MANTRLKDYFDLWVLLHQESLDLDQLREAIEATFSRRNTALPATLPIGLSEKFAADVTKQTQWKVFLKKNRLDVLPLDDVVHSLSTSLHRRGLI